MSSQTHALTTLTLSMQFSGSYVHSRPSMNAVEMLETKNTVFLEIKNTKIKLN